MYQIFIKRWFDFLFALFFIVLLSPLLMIIAILVRIKLGSPVLYRQSRSGRKEKIFTLYKFRTMTEKKDQKGSLLPDVDRMTRFGSFLRSTSLDELPELFNILKGNMSFIGPKPLLVKYLTRYNRQQRRRHEVKPGLTGLAQVKGGDALSWDDKFAWDLRYVERISVLMDLKILFLSLGTVFRRKGIQSTSSVTMEEFQGNPGLRIADQERQQLLILGAGGHGKSVADVAMKARHYQRIAFLDDNLTGECMGFDILGKISEVHEYIADWDLFVAFGSNAFRRQLQEQLEEENANFPILIHPAAILGDDVTIESGSVIMAGAIINCCTKIGKGCIINTASSVDHDNEIGDYVHISPGAHLAGIVKVGDLCWLGIGCIISNNVNIAANCIIGAGALVLKNIREAGIYIGVPVKRMRKRSRR